MQEYMEFKGEVPYNDPYARPPRRSLKREVIARRDDWRVKVAPLINGLKWYASEVEEAGGNADILVRTVRNIKVALTHAEASAQGSDEYITAMSELLDGIAPISHLLWQPSDIILKIAERCDERYLQGVLDRLNEYVNNIENSVICSMKNRID